MPLNNRFLVSLALLFSYGLVISASLAHPLAAADRFDRAVRTSPNFVPAIPHPDQEAAIDEALANLKKKTGKRPNVVWLVVDDMGYGDPGCYGGGDVVGAATPNMDRLAREGLKLTSCYSQPTCTPTRSAILTGRLPMRTGLIRPILAGDKLTKNPWTDEISLPKLLSEAGYYTLLCGKWHVGEAKGMRPFEIGFDEFFGFYTTQKEISQGFDRRRYPDLVDDPELLKAYRAIAPDNRLNHGFKNGDLQKLDEIVTKEQMAKVDQQLVNFTVQKIKDAASSDKPFFIEHCFMKVHCDNFPNPDLGSLSAAKYYYKEAMAEVDFHIGTVLNSLEETGVLENTFVFVTSDNGPQMDGWPDAGYTPFRGGKGTTFEGGVRVPGIAYWKGMIAPGRSSNEVFDLMDLFGVALHLAGIPRERLPSDRYYDFVDQTSFLLHDQGRSNRESVFLWWQTHLMGCRLREYKVHVKVILPQSTHMYIDLATLTDVGLAPWLFNLYIDPKEEMTVGHRRNAWLAAMTERLKAHAATFKAFPPKNIGLAP